MAVRRTEGTTGVSGTTRSAGLVPPGSPLDDCIPLELMAENSLDTPSRRSLLGVVRQPCAGVLDRDVDSCIIHNSCSYVSNI